MGVCCKSNSVVDVVRDSLGLDDLAALNDGMTLGELGAGRIDAVDILYRCGAYNPTHFRDGQLTIEGRKILTDAGKDTGYQDHLRLMSLEPMERMLSGLMIGEIPLIADEMRQPLREDLKSEKICL